MSHRGEHSAPQRLKGGWLEARDVDSYTLARQWPPRFDVAASARFPSVRRGRLARQIRQDLWRALKGLRGFSPVIQIAAAETGLTVTAGGRLPAKVPGVEASIHDLLQDPARRARWITWAQERDA